MNNKRRLMILDWMRKIHQLEYAHRYESIYYSSLERIVGIGAFLVTTLVAFSYRMPSAEQRIYECLPFFLKQIYFVPLASTTAAILTGLLTFLKPSERSETHKKTAASYEKLRHEIEIILTDENLENETLHNRLGKVKEEWDSLDAINVSNRNFKKGKAKVKSINKYPDELSFLD